MVNLPPPLFSFFSSPSIPGIVSTGLIFPSIYISILLSVCKILHSLGPPYMWNHNIFVLSLDSYFPQQKIMNDSSLVTMFEIHLVVPVFRSLFNLPDSQYSNLEDVSSQGHGLSDRISQHHSKCWSLLHTCSHATMLYAYDINTHSCCTVCTKCFIMHISYFLFTMSWWDR
jgi:hypothetical protein